MNKGLMIGIAAIAAATIGAYFIVQYEKKVLAKAVARGLAGVDINEMMEMMEKVEQARSHSEEPNMVH